VANPVVQQTTGTLGHAARQRGSPVAAEGARWDAAGPSDEPLAPVHTDWLRNRLTVSGPAGEVARFRAAARGTGGIPWHLDLDHEAARLLAPMARQGPDARALVRELREVIATRHDLVLARWHEAGGCPLDLHRLIPIPGTILQLGEDAPAARQWLWGHWGTTQKLRQVRVLEENGDRRLRRSARVSYAFLSADWTPWQAILRLRRDWPTLVLAVQPRYGETDEPGDA
jgi:hypothetical protein